MTHSTPEPRGELKWAAVDFDGTLAHSLWSPTNPTAALGAPIEGRVLQCEALAEAGFRVVIHTARPWSDHEAIELWLRHYGVPFHAVVCGKLLAAVYIDDRNVLVEDDWVETARYLSKGS